MVGRSRLRVGRSRPTSWSGGPDPQSVRSRQMVGRSRPTVDRSKQMVGRSRPTVGRSKQMVGSSRPTVGRSRQMADGSRLTVGWSRDGWYAGSDFPLCIQTTWCRKPLAWSDSLQPCHMSMPLRVDSHLPHMATHDGCLEIKMDIGLPGKSCVIFAQI